MRHGNHNHQLGVKKAHRSAMLASLSAALINHGRIQTTLAKAKALRPFVEKVVTMSVKAYKADHFSKKIHFRRLAIAQVRDKSAIKILFDEKVKEFIDRPGGYTRIYKLLQRKGDGAKIGLIELINKDDIGYKKNKNLKKSKT